MVTQAAAQEAVHTAQVRYGDLSWVNGIGLARIDGGYAVRINVSGEEADPAALPDSVDGVPVVVRRIGPVTLY